MIYTYNTLDGVQVTIDEITTGVEFTPALEEPDDDTTTPTVTPDPTNDGSFCDSGEYYTGSACVSCDSSCKTCDGSTDTDCLTCESGDPENGSCTASTVSILVQYLIVGGILLAVYHLVGCIVSGTIWALNLLKRNIKPGEGKGTNIMEREPEDYYEKHVLVK